MKRSIALLALMLPLLGVTGSAQASSPDWKTCGQVHYQGKNWLRAEAKSVGCRKALKVTRVFANGSLDRLCDTATHCVIEGFDCRIDNLLNKVLCKRGEARVRMRPARRH